MDFNAVKKTDYQPGLSVLASLASAGGTFGVLFHALPLSNQVCSGL